jgi:glycine cleavage system transcriptional repressor
VARFSLSAVGADRPGIVAAVSGALVDRGCNLEDSAMTILQGQFAILLVLAAPEGLTAPALEEAVAPAARGFDLVVSVRPLHEDPAPGDAGEPWTVSIHGADRVGLVHGVADALARAGGNVVDLSTHLVGEADAPVYVMTMRATLPAGEAGDAAAESVRRAAGELGVHCSLRRDDADVL